MTYSINTITNDILKGDLGANFRKGDWRICTQTEIDNYEAAQPLIDAKKNKHSEIEQKRDQKIKEDSTRNTEAEAGKTAVDALTTVEDVDAYSADGAFS